MAETLGDVSLLGSERTQGRDFGQLKQIAVGAEDRRAQGETSEGAPRVAGNTPRGLTAKSKFGTTLVPDGGLSESVEGLRQKLAEQAERINQLEEEQLEHQKFRKMLNVERKTDLDKWEHVRPWCLC